jgi:ribosomal protein VAR1, mitochondrial
MISLLPLYNPELGYKFEFVYSNKQLFLPSDLDIESYLFNHLEISSNNNSIKISKDNYQEYIKDTFFRPDNLNNKSYFMKMDILDSWLSGTSKDILTLKYYNNTYVLDTNLFSYSNNSNNKNIFKESNFTLNDIGLSVPTKYLGSGDRYIINIHIRDAENLYETIEYDTTKELKTPENIRYTYAYLGKSIFKNKIIVPNIIDKKTGDVIVFPNIPIFEFPEITETFLEVSYGNTLNNQTKVLGNNLPIIIDRYSEKLRSNNNSNNSNNSNNIENSIISNTSNILNNQNIIQPVFIKTYDLQTIYLVPNVTQNIAITGLEKFYNKVDYFLLKIGSSYQSREIGRLANNSGVVFKVTTEITNQLSSNKYHILNEKGEYITSGNIEVK